MSTPVECPPSLENPDEAAPSTPAARFAARAAPATPNHLSHVDDLELDAGPFRLASLLTCAADGADLWADCDFADCRRNRYCSRHLRDGGPACLPGHPLQAIMLAIADTADAMMDATETQHPIRLAPYSAVDDTGRRIQECALEAVALLFAIHGMESASWWRACMPLLVEPCGRPAEIARCGCPVCSGSAIDGTPPDPDIRTEAHP